MNLLESFGQINDPRQGCKTEHLLGDILAISVCAVLAGAESYEDIADYGHCKHDWLCQFLTLPNGIPSHDTFRRVFMLIDANQFEACFLHWTRTAFTRTTNDGEPDHIAIDGKTMRRSFNRRTGQSPLHVVSAFSTGSGVTLAQRVVSEKAGETTVLPDLLAGLELTGSLISLDALHCYKAISQTIVNCGADYLIALKGNQKKAHHEVKGYFKRNAFDMSGQLRPVADTIDNNHGRVTRRRAFVCEDISKLQTLQDWPKLAQVLAVETISSLNHVHGGGPSKVTADIRYFLTSAEASPVVIAAAIRNHWAIESLHWVLDVGFREDDSRIRDRNAAANLSVLRKISINLVKADTTRKGSIKRHRKTAGWNNDYMQKIISL
ncbi:ISAs1 family transposase [Pseudovibrio sp. Tun.PSC04-5.I4]|uniref:ISAs1 family transposase n=1 Tax=Pseudovibrio sp. Tun.PSC04-5.I4 TaxID=1798213 RepID=UPI000B831A82|nr:ISAs1 family transposase [Pseudovibrio sp. Tun.PSC04-5.I4]